MDELRQLSQEELDEKLHSLREELYDLRFQAKCGKLEKPSRISQVKHDIARILTLKREEKSVATQKETKSNEAARS